jgi:uracil-DNA glycosylase
LSVLQTQLRACRRCVDAGFLPAARPLTLGRAGAQVLLIGQAPSRTDHETGGFYAGPAGRRLRAWLADAGFDDTDFGTRIYATAITKCFPGRLPGSSKDRVPSRAEQRLCRPWLDAERAALDPAVIVPFGGLAIATILSREPLDRLVGRGFARDGRWVIPLPHASGASTWLNAPRNQALLADALSLLRGAAARSLPPPVEGAELIGGEGFP